MNMQPQRTDIQDIRGTYTELLQLNNEKTTQLKISERYEQVFHKGYTNVNKYRKKCSTSL